MIVFICGVPNSPWLFHQLFFSIFLLGRLFCIGCSGLVLMQSNQAWIRGIYIIWFIEWIEKLCLLLVLWINRNYCLRVHVPFLHARAPPSPPSNSEDRQIRYSFDSLSGEGFFSPSFRFILASVFFWLRVSRISARRASLFAHCCELGASLRNSATPGIWAYTCVHRSTLETE